MYSRKIGEKTFTFEPSGGLLNASLVMMDRETDSYWSIITEEAIYGDAQGAEMEQLPGAVKITFGEWRKRHPGTRVLSVEGKEHREDSPYDRYFASEKSFRDFTAGDDRLADKTLIYGIEIGDTILAVPFSSFEGGGVVTLGSRELFLYREKGDSHYRSTVALLAEEGLEFERRNGQWQIIRGDEILSGWAPASRSFGPDAPAEPFTEGFDTFWYIWRLTQPTTEIAPALGKNPG